MNKRKKVGVDGSKNKMKKENNKTFSVKFRGKKYLIKNYQVCSSFFSKTRGLMFRSSSFKTPLLFIFKKPCRESIHSFFCRKFIGVWMLNNKILEIKLVEPYKFSIVPKEKFNYLLEIPL